MVSSIATRVPWSCQTDWTSSYTLFPLRWEISVSVKRRSGLNGTLMVTRKVISAETQILCLKRMWYCSLVRPCMRKACGVRYLLLMIVSPGAGGVTPAVVDLVISATAARMRFLKLLWRRWSRAS